MKPEAGRQNSRGGIMAKWSYVGRADLVFCGENLIPTGRGIELYQTAKGIVFGGVCQIAVNIRRRIYRGSHSRNRASRSCGQDK